MRKGGKYILLCFSVYGHVLSIYVADGRCLKDGRGMLFCLLLSRPAVGSQDQTEGSGEY